MMLYYTYYTCTLKKLKKNMYSCILDYTVQCIMYTGLFWRWKY